nr:pitrilysin family protein [uncultured Flavobacterium sp.]
MKKIFIIATALMLSLSSEAQIKRPQPQPGPAPSVNISKPKEFTLKNGLKVLVVEDHKLPRVSYSLTIDTPPYHEGNIAGVSSLTSAVVGNGTKKISKEAFNEEIDFLGANISFWNTGASGSGLSKYSDRILEIMADGALNPIFSQEEFDKSKAQAIEGLKASEKSVSAVAGRVENALLFGTHHPYGEFETEETFNNITLQDVKDNYASYFVPENAYLIIIGDVDYKKVKKQVEKLFGGWKKASAPKQEFPATKNVAKTQIDFVDMPNAVQSEIAIVNAVELKMTDKDYFATIMANQILGGGGEGRLFLNLREAHGWTYGAYSSIGAGKYTSKFKATASVRNAVTDSAVVEFMNEIHKVRTEAVTEDELKLAKAKYIGSFVMGTQKAGTIASFALRTKTQNLPADFYENYIKNLNAVTVQDVQNAAKRYFQAENLRIIIVGKAADVLPGLEKLPYPIHFYDKFGKPTSKPELKKEIPAGVTVKSVIENYTNAIGGEAKLKTVKSLSTTANATVQGMELTSVTKQTNKGQLNSTTTMMGQTMSKQVITPSMGYVEQQGQKQTLTGDDLKQAQAAAKLFSEIELASKPGVVLVGIENIEGSDAYGIKDGDTTHYFDVKSGLKTATATAYDVQGQQGVQTVYFADYKDVKGIKVPFKTTMNMGIDIEMITKDVKVNEGVSDADFK